MSKDLTKRWREHLDSPKFMIEKTQASFEVQIYLDSSFKSLHLGISGQSNIGYHFDKNDERTGLIDAYFQLYQMQADRVGRINIDARELDYYLRDKNTESSFANDSEAAALVNSLNNAVNDYLSLSKDQSYQQLSTVEKMTKIKLVLEEFFNKKFQSAGKQAQLIDVDDDVIVVNVQGSLHCDLDKDLEYLQNLLQDKLNHYDINVIPEC